MTDTGSGTPPPPGAFSGDLHDPDIPVLREHFRDITRWVIGDAVGDQLPAGQSDALAEELAVILASGLAPALRREVERQIEKTIESLQNGPVSFDHYSYSGLRVDGFTVPELVQLLDAVGRLVENGVQEAISGLHETHRRILYSAHHSWLEKNGLANASDEDDDEDEDEDG